MVLTKAIVFNISFRHYLANKETKFENSLHVYVLLGQKMDKLVGADYFSSRTMRKYVHDMGKMEPDISFSNLEHLKGRRMFLKFDEVSLNFTGKIYTHYNGIGGLVTPFVTDNISTTAKQVLQFLLTDVDDGKSFVGPYFFVDTMSSSELQHVISRVVLACQHYCEILAVTFDGLSSHVKFLEEMVVDGYKSFLGPIFIYDPIHSLSLLWRLLVRKQIIISATTSLNKSTLVRMFESEQNEFRKHR